MAKLLPIEGVHNTSTLPGKQLVLELKFWVVLLEVLQ
jgi:hypothetical protein